MEAANWEWPIFVDLWAAGVAGGGFFAAFLIDRFSGGRHKRLVQVATWIGVPLALLGVLLLVVDLGNQLWFWHLLVGVAPVSVVFHPLSPMSIGTYVLTLWSISGACLIILWLAEADVPVFRILGKLAPLTKVLVWVSFVLSPLVITYTGVLLSNTNVPMWSTVLLPALFVVSAIFTGTAAFRLVQTLFGKGKGVPAELGKASIILAILVALALIGYLVIAPADILVSGSLAPWFWIGVVVIGLAVPVGLDLAVKKAKGATALVVVSTLCVLLGGLILRAVISIGGQM
jgi:formate-dependent nitrite reductase membrane component NrfD